jgi:hypothetical protein
VEDFGQLTERSKQEIEAGSRELGLPESGYFVEKAAELLAGLRLWRQDHDRADEGVHEILTTGDIEALQDAVRELRDRGTPEAREASESIVGIMRMPARERQGIVSHACLAFC